MPQTPLPLGDMSGQRDEEPRWFEPVLIEPVPMALLEPELVTPDASAPPPLPVREAVRWKEIQWVDFSTDATGDEAEPEPWVVSRVPPAVVAAPRPEPEPELQSEPEPQPEPAAQAQLPLAIESAAVAGAESTVADPITDKEPAAWRVELDPADQQPAVFPTAPYRTVHTSRIAAGWEAVSQGMQTLGSNRLNRVTQVGVFSVVLAVIVGVTYEGGEHVAGRAGATTPPLLTAYTDGKLATMPDGDALGPALAPNAASVPQPPTDEAAARAIAFLKKAKAGDPIAQYNVAVLYARGEGLAQDFGSANAWFLRAAETGNLAAQFNIGVMYQRGLGVQQDLSEAMRWYRKAADHHYAPAEYNLAIAYEEGQGTPKDLVAAARWYHQAATQGLVSAMINFAILYEKGDGVERSPIDAYSWYRAAAQRGDGIAEKRAGELFGQMDAAAKKQAQAQAMAIAAMIRLAPSDLVGVAQPAPSAAAAPSVLPVSAADKTASR